MSEAKERFIEAAVAPFADNAELQIAARQQVAEMVLAECDESDLIEAAGRLENQVGKRWRWIWLGVVLVVSLVLIVPAGYRMKRAIGSYQLVSPITPFPTVESPKLPAWAHKLTSQQRLVIFGAIGESRADDRWRPLKDSAPENPKYYQEYAQAYLSEHSALPPRFLEEGMEIDTGNGWYALVAASVGAKKLLKPSPLSQADREMGKPVELEMLDPVEVQKRIVLLEEACASPRMERFCDDLMVERLELIPRPMDLSAAIGVIALAAEQRAEMTLLGVSKMVSVEAQRCLEDGDSEGFRSLEEIWRKIVDYGLDESVTLVDGLLVQAFMSYSLSSMRDAAASLEVNPEYWSALELAVRERKSRIKGKRSAPDDSVINQHGSMLVALSLPMMSRMAEGNEPITKEDCLPSCRVEQAFFGKIFAISGWKVLGLILFLSWLAVFFRSLMARRLGARLVGLLDRKDLWWIGLGGVLGAVIVFLILRYATPLSRLDWGPRMTFYAIPIGHFIALLIMLMVWPVVIAAWRLDKAGRVLGWTWEKRWCGYSAAISPVIGMALLGFTVPMGGHSLLLAFVAIGCWLWALVWLVFLPGLRGGGKRGHTIRKSVIRSSVRPAWLGGMLAFAVLIPLLQLEERRWMARDTLMIPSSSMTAYEGRVTEQLVMELREILDGVD